MIFVKSHRSHDLRTSRPLTCKCKKYFHDAFQNTSGKKTPPTSWCQNRLAKFDILSFPTEAVSVFKFWPVLQVTESRPLSQQSFMNAMKLFLLEFRACIEPSTLLKHTHSPPQIDAKKDQLSDAKRELKSAKADAKVRKDEKSKKWVFLVQRDGCLLVCRLLTFLWPRAPPVPSAQGRGDQEEGGSEGGGAADEAGGAGHWPRGEQADCPRHLQAQLSGPAHLRGLVREPPPCGGIVCRRCAGEALTESLLFSVFFSLPGARSGGSPWRRSTTKPSVRSLPGPSTWQTMTMNFKSQVCGFKRHLPVSIIGYFIF